MLLAAFVLGAVAQDQTCDAVSMTIAGGPCDGVVAPTKACGGKSLMPGDSSTWVRFVRTAKLNFVTLERA